MNNEYYSTNHEREMSDIHRIDSSSVLNVKDGLKISCKSVLVKIVALFVLALSMTLFMVGCASNHPVIDYATLSASIDNDGIAYIAMMDGSFITIDDDVKRAVMTKDRKTIVVLRADGTVYYTDKAQKNKHIVSDNVEDIINIKNDGFFYVDEAKITYRVLYADESVVELGADLQIVVATDTTSVLFADDKNGVFTLKANDNTVHKVGAYVNKVWVYGITNDGSVGVWSQYNNRQTTIMYIDDISSHRVGEVSGLGTGVAVNISNDQNLVVITKNGNDTLWILEKGDELVTVNLNNSVADENIYSTGGLIEDNDSNKIQSLYVLVESTENSKNLYAISLDGERERVVSKVREYSVAGEYLYYVNADSDLYYAKIDGNTLINETKIATDVDMFKVSLNGMYIYYMRDCDIKYGTLYAYKVGKEEPVKIATDVSCKEDSVNFSISLDGNTIYYFIDCEDIFGVDIDYYGTLMKWEYSTNKSTKISSDIIIGVLKSGYERYVDSNHIVMSKYNSGNVEEYSIGNSVGYRIKHMEFDVIYYDGTKTNKLYSIERSY